jgi:uncharacterized protein YggU (UPF0235/DUF167 family)
VAKTQALAKSAVELKSGQTLRRKALEVQGATTAAVASFVEI